MSQCQVCEGGGQVLQEQQCRDCYGRGETTLECHCQMTDPWGDIDEKIPCLDCGDSGTQVKECVYCEGNGVKRETVTCPDCYGSGQSNS